MNHTIEMKLLHTSHIDVRWGDMDALGHVNNTRYFVYMEQARVEWLAKVGDPVDLATNAGPILANASCTFKKPVVFPARLRIELYPLEIRTRGFNLGYKMFDTKSDELVAEGQSVIVWVDYKSGKPITLPNDIRQALG